MSEPKIDPEQLAALLDGRLDERQRAEVMARLAESPEDFEAYVDAVAVVGELERGTRSAAGGGEAEVIPLRRPEKRTGFRVTRWQWLAAAAVIAGVAVVPLMRRDAPSPAGDVMDPGVFVEALANEDAGLPAGWNGRPWSTTRSAGDPLTPEARAVRIGARLVDLELAMRAGDTSARGLAREIATLLEARAAAGPVIAVYGELSQRVGERAKQLELLLQRGRVAAAQLAGAEFVNLGAWVETARVAAVQHDSAFLRSAVSKAAVQRARRLLQGDARVRQTIDRVGSAAINAPPDWRVLQRELTRLLEQLAGN